jgi:hypothetical protein
MIHGFSPNDDNNIKVWDDNKQIEPILDNVGDTTGTWKFSDINEENDMQDDDDITDRFHENINLTTINITDYIQHHFQSGDKAPLFEHVYEPVLGTREVLVTRKHIPEALDLI